ncbi:cytochrome c oxidase subunit 3 family protein [bacterium]|nr:cytochrome c oxidase subunit 3 family protein [bacterium]
MEIQQTATPPSALQHHYSDIEQQHDSAKFGMWLFLVTEILFFGGLFCAYAIYRSWYPEMFHNAHKVLSVPMGALNTVVLIVSSLTMALSIRSVQLNKSKQALGYLIATFGFAAVFMVVKYFEYSHKFHVGQLPGKFYFYDGIAGANPHQFFSIYFAMTGLHGAHILIGMIVMIFIMIKLAKGAYSPQNYAYIENFGLYWHLVDMFWIFLFPLLYLIG